MYGHLGGQPVGSSETFASSRNFMHKFLHHSGTTSCWKYAVGKDCVSVARCRFFGVLK